MPGYAIFLAIVYSFCTLVFLVTWVWLIVEQFQKDLPGIKRKIRIKLGHLKLLK